MEPFSSYSKDQINYWLPHKIAQGLREAVVPGTPNEYASLYQECWKENSDARPLTHVILGRLREIFVEDILKTQQADELQSMFTIEDIRKTLQAPREDELQAIRSHAFAHRCIPLKHNSVIPRLYTM